MSASIFDPEKGFWRLMSRVVDVLSLSLLWTFCSLPVITLGAATAALYDAAARGMRGQERSPWKRFLRTFRRELGTSAAVTVVWGALLFLLANILRLLWQAQVNDVAGAPVMLAAFLVLLLLPVGAACWMFPLLSRFTFRPAGLMMTSLRFAVGYLPYTLVIVAVTALAALAVWMLWLPVFVLPCLTALLWSLPMERAFRRYMPPEEPLPPEDEEQTGDC